MNYCTTEKCNVTVAISISSGLHAVDGRFFFSLAALFWVHRFELIRLNGARTRHRHHHRQQQLAQAPESYLYPKQLIPNNTE